MGIVSVKESWRGGTAQRGIDGRTASRQFEVTLSGFAAPKDVLADSRLPQPGQAHPTDQYLRCVRTFPQEIVSPVFVRIQADYDNQGRSSGSQLDDPLAERPVVRIGFATSSEARDVDALGERVQNTAWRKFDPPLQFQINDLVLSIVRNEASFPVWKARLYNDTTNADPFCGAAPGQARLTVEAEQQERNGNIYARVAYTITFRDGIPVDKRGAGGPAKAWSRSIRNQGLESWDGHSMDANGFKTLSPIIGGDGQPVREPVDLDPDGKVLATGDDPVWLEYAQCRSVPFGPLNLLGGPEPSDPLRGRESGFRYFWQL